MYDDTDLMDLYDLHFEADDRDTFEENCVAMDREGEDFGSEEGEDYEPDAVEDGHLDASWEDAISGAEVLGD